jgi:HD-GYP domain-containing protein (c-di-GMP phosphodiesterase class II)
MARKMLLPEQTVKGVYIGAMMHDVGMAGIDERVLNKPGRLTDEEMQEVSLHVEIGSKIVEKVPFLQPASGIVRHHHERWDGDGYPDGIAGKNIPVGARIVAVADAFEALVSRRPYREAYTVVDALEEIRRCGGAQFDPAVVRALERAVLDQQRWGTSVFQQHYSVDIAR